jgi:hypothetical protein
VTTSSEIRDALGRANVDPSGVRTLLDTSDGLCYTLSTHGSRAISLWKQLREVVPRMGYWPVLIGEDEDVEALKERMQSREFGTTPAIVEAALAIDPISWFTQRQEEVVDELLEFGGDPYQGAPAEEAVETREAYRGMTRGVWPWLLVPTNDFFLPFKGLTDEPLPNVHFALVPTRCCWHVPALIQFGGWNECPTPDVHVCLMKFWYELFGAEVVGVSRDVVEMLVSRPPATKTEALELAKQQYLYSADIVDQGTQTLEALAATLVRGSSWFFWWD